MQSFFESALAYGPVAITAAAAAAATLPRGTPGTVWFKVRAVIDFLALNFGNARNFKP